MNLRHKRVQARSGPEVRLYKNGNTPSSKLSPNLSPTNMPKQSDTEYMDYNSLLGFIKLANTNQSNNTGLFYCLFVKKLNNV